MFGGVFGGGGLFNVVSQLALATVTGGTSLAFTSIFSQLASQVGQQIIQQIGQQLGVSPQMIDLAQATFASQIGDTSGVQQNLNELVNGLAAGNPAVGPVQTGQIMNSLEGAIEQMVTAMIQDIEENSGGENASGAGGGEGGGSLLMQIARALGRSIDDKLLEMRDKAEQLGNLDDATGDDAAQYGQLSAEIQALGQETNFLSQALTNTLRSIGEAASTLARKS
ncbi:MAG: hypothetical protein AAFY22_07350 [Pseudomonadota bacterium]